MGCMSSASEIIVFTHAHIFLAMKIILYAPMVLNGLSRAGQRELLPCCIREGVGRFSFCAPGAMIITGALDFKNLV